MFINILQCINHNLSGLGIEVSGRLIRKDQIWIIDQRTANRNSLFFSAGYFIWLLLEKV